MYHFSKRSFAEMVGVRPELIVVAGYALSVSKVDFLVTDGLRTVEEQEHLVAIGASHTMKSKHLEGRAIDVAAWVGGVRWDWPLFPKIAEAFREGAERHRVKIRWGAVWDKPMDELEDDLVVAVRRYVTRVESIGGSPFIDGPHFELVE